MKYLKIHIAIWWIICLIVILVKCIFFLLASLFYFIWNFKLLKWEQIHKEEYLTTKYEKVGNLESEYIATELILFKNPIESFTFYFNYFKNA